MVPIGVAESCSPGQRAAEHSKSQRRPWAGLALLRGALTLAARDVCHIGLRVTGEAVTAGGCTPPSLCACYAKTGRGLLLRAEGSRYIWLYIAVVIAVRLLCLHCLHPLIGLPHPHREYHWTPKGKCNPSAGETPMSVYFGPRAEITSAKLNTLAHASQQCCRCESRLSDI